MACFLFITSVLLFTEFGVRSCMEKTNPERNNLLRDVHTRRRGLIPHSRRRGDTHDKFNELFLLKTKQVNKDKALIENHKRSVDLEFYNMIKRHHRQRRWDYDDTYDWENGGKDYDIPGQEKKESTFEKFAKNWQKHALKVIFIFCVCATICICCVGCCKKCCGKIFDTICWHCKDWRDLALNRDPTFRKARKFADDYGVQLDYNQYKKIKKNYEDGFKRQGNMEYANLSGR